MLVLSSESICSSAPAVLSSFSAESTSSFHLSMLDLKIREGATYCNNIIMIVITHSPPLRSVTVRGKICSNNIQLVRLKVLMNCIYKKYWNQLTLGSLLPLHIPVSQEWWNGSSCPLLAGALLPFASHSLPEVQNNNDSMKKIWTPIASTWL